MATIDDLVNNLKNGVVNIGQIAQTLGNAFPRVSGTFTLANATVTAITQPGIVANGFPIWAPTNAAAALIERTAGLYVASVTAGTGFSMSTQTGTAQGTETFSYVLYNPA
jgi:hypothetical protein